METIMAMTLQAKAERKAERAKLSAAMAEQLTVGTILYYSWGYDQTNIEFFQVIRNTGKSVIVREIASESVEGSQGFMSEQVKPVRDAFIGPELRKIIGPYGLAMDFGSLSPIGGRESFYRSWYA
jgi:hypothetical protein